ncbi:hypothetical protein [Variovorax sp. tm]|uniref:hypothetical protein n=1 Tax=Variovorax atrisoli TaxID=3394203 RepID=UPI003A7F8D24
MRTSELEQMLAQYVIGSIAISIIGTLIGLYVLYLVIRWGVRDGMRDAQRGLRDQREPVRGRPPSTGSLPDMRAD